jgi:adenosylcobinamide-GDP ribazoletransferase
MDAFLHALQFLTRIPVGSNREYKQELAGPSVSWYAPIGLVIGVIIAICAWVFTEWLQLSPFVSSALVLAVWVGITGALHLDGLGDCSDAWMGGHTRERMLEIMKDTSSGIGAVVSVVLILLIKTNALALLVAHGDWSLLIFAPISARLLLTLVVRYQPYVREGGLGASMRSKLDDKGIVIAFILLTILLCFISFEAFVYTAVACGLAYLLIHWCFIRRIKGVTGDVYGALVEVAETAVLVGLVSYI